MITAVSHVTCSYSGPFAEALRHIKAYLRFGVLSVPIQLGVHLNPVTIITNDTSEFIIHLLRVVKTFFKTRKREVIFLLIHQIVAFPAAYALNVTTCRNLLRKQMFHCKWNLPWISILILSCCQTGEGVDKMRQITLLILCY